MARAARLVLPDQPCHVTHRGNHRKRVFDDDSDRAAYLGLLSRYSQQFGLRIWAYCLMDNHVHLIVVGRKRESMSKAIGNAHRAYSRIRNQCQGVTGHLWANRFHSALLDETHLWAAVRYVELNPVRAGTVDEATRYRWSSAAAHAGGTRDPLLDPDRPFPGPISDWAAWLRLGLPDVVTDAIRGHTRTGRPIGSEGFVRHVEHVAGVRPRSDARRQRRHRRPQGVPIPRVR